MAISIYDATVAGFLQGLGGVAGFLDKGAAHCAATGVDPAELVAARIHPDMYPLAFQIWSVGHHSLRALEGCRAGAFAPPPPTPDWDYAGWQAFIAQTTEALAAVTPEEVSALEGKDVVFQIGEMKIPFTAEGFLLSFSIPNFFFHATTAYDILRARGVPIGKRDFTGKLRIKR